MRPLPLHCITILLLISWSFIPVLFCASASTLVPGMTLTPGKTLVSDQGVFALGFFSPSNSTGMLYVGIWFNDIPQRTVVWVANRDDPITDASSAMLAMTDNSSLVLSENNGGRVLWMAIGGGSNSSAKLLNSGNLVVLSSDGATTLWQSFRNPSDAVLAGLPFRLSHRTLPPWRIVSWKGPQDPSKGEFSAGLDPSTPLQFFVWHGSVPYWRAAVWGGYVASNIDLQRVSPLMYLTVYREADGETYSTFGLSDGSSMVWCKLDYSGKFMLFRWNISLSDWAPLSSSPAHECNQYGYCGAYGYCDNMEANPTCKCLDGFHPNDSVQWARGDFSQGCQRKEALRCGGSDGFLTLPAVKVPDRFIRVWNKTFDECTAECSSNCSCVAYAYANLSTSNIDGDATRCLMWTGELIDVEKSGLGNENFYLRLAVLSNNRQSDIIVKLLPSILACVLLILAFACLVWVCKFKGKKNKDSHNILMTGDVSISDELGEDHHELPFINLEDIVTATNNFSMSNLLGQGGFGKVYKGILGGYMEVAVKRLSKGAGQGTTEFRNEVVLIAKLQHKNLVKLLYCCVQGDERLIIYEFLPNKSLDTFIFNYDKKRLLDWPTRFKIIKGIARGLLYLHQDSRLMIIHRDLKASNILLDGYMNPKISDFGMARIFGGNEEWANTNRVVGTYGYMSPEYALEGLFSVKSDVYSFGVLLLEIVSGLRISTTQHIMEFPNLLIYAWNLWREGLAKDLVDASVVESCPHEEVLLCTMLPSPDQPFYFAPRNKTTEKGDFIQNSVDKETLTLIEGR